MHTVQIKRKRDQEPLQTLVVRAKRKRLDTVFRLAGTVSNHAESDIVLSSTGEGVFRLPPKDHSAIDDDIPPELKDMINDYMSQSTQEDKEAPGDGPAQEPVVAVDSPDAEAEDYVYDVYYSKTSQAAGSGSGKVGYIDVESDDERLLADEDDESDFVGEEEDDSNAEDFYRNDYPDEEDSFGGSDLGVDLADLKIDEDWSEDMSA